MQAASSSALSTGPSTPIRTGAPPPDWLCIDWSRPWLESLWAVGAPLAQQVAQGQAVHDALNSALPEALQKIGLRFVPQADLPPSVAYEAFIHAQRRVPTRHNFHDFFNGLVWLHWPQLKLHMNRLQADAITRDGVGARRGPLRDALTVLDENGAIWWAPAPLIEALRAREWQRLMVTLRPLWAHSRLLPVGHALLEKLVLPRKPITAHLLCVAVDGAALPLAQDFPAVCDAGLASQALVQAATLGVKPFTALPVLGVPGWWAPNENFSFYDDSLVFRSQRPATSITTQGLAEVTAA